MTAPRLSLCMIVRDEEAMLPDLLAGVDGLWDELVVADTGSVDGTVALLEDAGATVVHHPWNDDFAAARNASLAPATGDWILFLDADERVTPALREQIGRLVRDPRAGAATVTMRNTLPDGTHRDAALLRLFRNDPAIRFRHRIHEDVLDDVEAYLARTGLELRHLDGVVDHLGYVREVAADRAKKERDEALLRRTLAEDPDDLYCWFKLLELARFWEDEALAAETARAAAPRFAGELAPEARRTLARNPWSGELAVLIARHAAGDPAAELAWLDDHADRVRRAAAWHLRRAELLEELGRPDEAAAAFDACLADATAGAAVHHLRARLGHCRLAAAGGDLEGATRLAAEAAAGAPRDAEALLALVTLTGLSSGQDAVRRTAAAHATAHPGAAGAVAAALLEAGHAAPASDILAAAVAEEPPLALGLLTCALALGRRIDLTVDVDRETADREFRAWIRRLWESRRTNLMAAFADNAGTVTGLFPWLEDYLVSETARLRGGSPPGEENDPAAGPGRS